MMQVPATSVTLLRAISGAPDSVRWVEFFRRYEEPMRAFLAARYPSVEPDDVIQETLKALAERLPNYHYVPDEKGYFHNYLMGIVRHKADDACRAQARETAKLRNFRAAGAGVPEPGEDDEWKMSALQAAVEQLMSDQSLVPRTREIFRHVALMHERPESVAAQFGTTRNNVDQIKKRLIKRLAKCVAAMTEVA